MRLDALDEIWKDISKYPRYQASSLGQIRFKPVKTTDENRRKKHSGEIVHQSLNADGYMSVGIVKDDGKVTGPSVHSLVCLAFYGEKPKGFNIDHIDGNKLNNRVENLEYVTVGENNRRCTRDGRHRSRPYKVFCLTDGLEFDSIEKARKFYHVDDIQARAIPTAVKFSDGWYQGRRFRLEDS